MEVKEWKENPITVKMLKMIKDERQDALERLLNAENKDESIGIVKGITMIYDLIDNMEDRNLYD